MKAKILRRILFLIPACLPGQQADAQSAPFQPQAGCRKESELLLGYAGMVKDKQGRGT